MIITLDYIWHLHRNNQQPVHATSHNISIDPYDTIESFQYLEVIRRAAKSHVIDYTINKKVTHTYYTTVKMQSIVYMPSFGSHTIGVTAQSLIHIQVQRAFAPSRERRETLSYHKHSTAQDRNGFNICQIKRLYMLRRIILIILTLAGRSVDSKRHEEGAYV
jgi:hypothetical protein